MIIYKENQSAPMGYHNGIPVWDGVKPEPADVYYMLGDGSKLAHVVIPSINTTNITVEFVLIPGSYVGELYVGVGGNDNTDLRWFAYQDTYAMFDSGSGRVDGRGIYTDITHKYHIITSKNGDQCNCVMTDLDTGGIIWSPSLMNNVSIAGDLQIIAQSNMKLYSMKATIDNVLVVDAVATANGLYDNVSGNIITLPHFTPVKE